jgi:hypothetical protein
MGNVYLSEIEVDADVHGRTFVNGKAFDDFGERWLTSPISLVSQRFRDQVKMHCARYGLKEVSIVGRVFLANGDPKYPNGQETRKSLA